MQEGERGGRGGERKRERERARGGEREREREKKTRDGHP
jgi:hypothetical protein